MKYNAKLSSHIQKARIKFEYLIANKKTFELTEKKAKRSISQNSYIHLLFASFAEMTGYTTSEVKQDIFKRIVNPELFYEGEFGNLAKVERWRSTADLDKAEMTLAVNRFLNYASQNGYYLPNPQDLANLTESEIIEFHELEMSINNAKEFI